MVTAQHADDPRRFSSPVPYVRAVSVAPFLEYMSTLDMPLTRWQEEAQLPTVAMADPEALVPLHSGYRFLNIAIQRSGLTDLGARVAARTSVFELGALGQILQRSATVLDYLTLGSRVINSHNSGTTLWLSREEDCLRVNQRIVPGCGSGPATVDVNTLVLTLATLRRCALGDWQPAEIRLCRGAERAIDSSAFSPRTRIVEGASHTSFTLPLELLGRPMREPGAAALPSRRRAHAQRMSMPGSFCASIEMLVRMQLDEGEVSVGTVAEAAGMSPRGLQRRLADAGTRFSSILGACRADRARHLLANSDLSVAAIAVELGYTDASNFTRAFSREMGLSPRSYRQAATGVVAGEASRVH